MTASTTPAGQPLLSIRGLTTEFWTPAGVIRAVDGVSYDVRPGETLSVVGESGSGKSITVLSLLGLIPRPTGEIVGGQALFEGRDLLKLSEPELRRVRGRSIGMVFQDPMTSLNPVLTVGRQITEAIRTHHRVSAKAARARGIDLLERVGIAAAASRYDEYPNKFSGGMRQRVMIAIALANNPKLLIADEPTTALDVTIQAQVLEVLRLARDEFGVAIILITHDLGLVAELADRVVVMYGGRVVENGPVEEIFSQPRHPYTLGLMSSRPRVETDLNRLIPIAGSPPDLLSLPEGCAFEPRCRLARGRDLCVRSRPERQRVAPERESACHYHAEMAAETTRVEDLIGSRFDDGAGR